MDQMRKHCAASKYLRFINRTLQKNVANKNIENRLFAEEVKETRVIAGNNFASYKRGTKVNNKIVYSLFNENS